jgi:FtsP/CotA-like multicopper oxidase with cupredoxin domain
MINRRHFVAAAAAAGAAGFVRRASAADAAFETPLPIPQLIDARTRGNAARLIAAKNAHAFFPGRPAQAYGYSGSVLGPAIRVRRGDEVEITVENKLDRGTTVHWHGLIIPSEQDGAPHDNIAPGKTWRPVLKIDQPETTAWFHPHPHRETARQVYFGFAGLMLIEDGTGERLGLPRTYGVDDIPLIIQDRDFDEKGALIYNVSPMTVMHGFRGERILVNGAIAPVAKVPKGFVRLRVLNGSNARNYNLSFTDRRAFHVIASDGGYLDAPVQLTQLVIAPGERFEMLADFSDGKSAMLQTTPDEFTPAGAGADTEPLVKFEPDAAKAAAATEMPKSLVTIETADTTKASRRRNFVLNDHMMGMMMGGSRGPTMAINGRPFDMERVDVKITRGDMEIWHVESEMLVHPFHIHGVQFRVLSVDGRKPAAHLQGWKDTVLVPRAAELLVRFTQSATPDHPFMYHCHILEHEDAGMMGQYVCA